MTYLEFSRAPLEMVALTTSQINIMIYLIDITNMDKICANGLVVKNMKGRSKL